MNLLLWLTCAVVFGWGGSVSSAPAGALRFEDLGAPLAPKAVEIQFVTQTPDARRIAWGVIESPERNGVFGIDTESGESIWLNLAKTYVVVHIHIQPDEEGNVFIYVGRPGRFLKYIVTEKRLIDLGAPSQATDYTLSHTMSPDGRMYVGSYPTTQLVSVDLKTGATKDHGRIAEDPAEKYLLFPAVSDENIVYCPVGLHHPELWAYDANTGARHQILPESFREDPLVKAMRTPKVWLESDGHVYGISGKHFFRCHADRIELLGKTEDNSRARLNGKRVCFHLSGGLRLPANPRRVGREDALTLDSDGNLVLRNAQSGNTRTLPTDQVGAAIGIFSVGDEWDGKIYGGGLKPANTFVFDPKTGKSEDLGLLGGGTIQVYDTLCHERGLFISSYMNASLTFFDPAKPKSAENPRQIATLSKQYEQERAQHLTLGPDGMIYTGTIPIKGRLGGALVRVDPETFDVRVWRNVLPNQSLMDVTSVPETGELFCCSSISGGTSALPTEKEACVFLWDPHTEQIVWQGQPVPGAKEYRRAVLARNGLIYGISDERSFAFDPKKRRTLTIGRLPVKRVRFPYLADRPAGPYGLIVGLGDDALFAVDFATNRFRVLARDRSISKALGMHVTEAGTLYFGSGPRLMRVNLYPK